MTESEKDRAFEDYKHELNKRLEDHKHTLVCGIEAQKTRNERYMAILRALLEYAQIAIRTVILVNGAGVTAVMTLLGIKQANFPVNHVVLGVAAGIFALGVSCGVAASMFAYLSQYQILRIMRDTGGDMPIGIRWERTAGMISVILGLAAFLIAVVVAIIAFLPGHSEPAPLT
jgi:hypothetical protein